MAECNNNKEQGNNRDKRLRLLNNVQTQIRAAFILSNKFRHWRTAKKIQFNPVIEKKSVSRMQLLSAVKY